MRKAGFMWWRHHISVSSSPLSVDLQEKFGDEIRITKGGKKVGLKPLDAFSGHNTDELANDSDLDISTCT